MSRTIRRKGKKNPYPRKDTHYGFRWGWLDWQWHSDKYRYGNEYSRVLKEFTNYNRRTHERKMLFDLAKDPEADYYAREKEYLGYIWNFD